jgi:hypothetical protein
VLVDVGCGKGRVINYWLARGYRNRIVGLELGPDVADSVRRRVKSWPNLAIVTGDAVDNLPRDGTIFYAFNPFASGVMSRLKAGFEALPVYEWDVVLLYYNYRHKRVSKATPPGESNAWGRSAPCRRP